jgi:hypothetical protein
MYKMLITFCKKLEGGLRLHPPTMDNFLHPKQGMKLNISSLYHMFSEYVNNLQLSVTILQINSPIMNQLLNVMHVDFYMLGTLMLY